MGRPTTISRPKADRDFYLPAAEFFPTQKGIALTYDDVSLATNYSEVLPRDADLTSPLSDSLTLNIPVLSSDMDTVTEGKMAIAMAQNGGLGLIHYNMTAAEQAKQVAMVKHHIHGVIQSPITVQASQTIGDVLELIERKRFNFRTFPVIDPKGTLLGLLSGAIVKDRYRTRTVNEAMTPVKDVFTINEKQLSRDPIREADRFFSEHIGIHKLLVVDDQGRLKGLVTASDIEQILQESKQRQKPTRDADFRLVVGAAVPIYRKSDGSLDKDKVIEHVEILRKEYVDALAVSTAHGHTKGVGEMVRLLRREYKTMTLIAGNVTSGEGVDYLAKMGADAIKIGQGPGSICTTRLVAGVGVPQLTALYVASRAALKAGVRIIADGGITKSGDIVKALTLSDAVILGGMLAGCPEAPGEMIEIDGKRYKQYRGMGSAAAMKRGSASRYGHETKDATRKAAAEGIEALKEVSSSANDVLAELAGGVQAGMGYLGARTLNELKQLARFVRVSPAGQREAAPHDVVEIKASTSRQ